MPVKLEDMNSIIIRIDRLYGCPSIKNVARFLDEQISNGIGCGRDEHLLVLPGGMNQIDRYLSIEFFEQQGLKLTKKVKGVQCWEDVCIIASATGPTLPCPWLDWDPENGTVSLKESERTVGTVIIAHGKESGPLGNKIKALAQIARKHRFTAIAPDFRGMNDPEERVAHLLDMAQGIAGPLYLAGSSMGGYVAIRASQVLETKALFLMAPAVGLPGYADQQLVPGCRTIRIVHAWQDEVIPAQQVVAWARQHGAELHLVNSDHRLGSELELLRHLFSCMLRQPTP
ncbi:MAG: alpha/beta hydrolase [Geobacter sp.]|nr:alpha/beta hydrolase [Geobacter sp.]